MIKILLVILMLLIVFSMVTAMSMLENNYYWRSAFFKMQWDYLITEIAFKKYSYNGEDKLVYSGKESEDLGDGGHKKADSIPVLLYHGVIEDANWEPDYVNVRSNDFRNQMFALKRAGWETVKLEDYLAFVKGEKELPLKSFLLTFDDGRVDSYYPVDPILRALDYTAVMHVITNRSFSGNSKQETFHLSREELRKMLDSRRWQMASHGRDDHDLIPIGASGQKGHFLSNKMWMEKEKRIENQAEYEARIYKDLLESKKDIEKGLGIKVLAFAYPFGDFGQTTENFPESRGEVIDEVRKIYDMSFCQTASGDFPGNYKENSFLAKRISVSSFMSPQDLLGRFEKNFSKDVDYSDDFSENKGWISGWGKFDLRNNAMIISNSKTDESGQAFLIGSYPWRDYFLSARVKVHRRGSISVASRYHDGNNYMSCDFGQNTVSLVRKINKELKSELVAPTDKNLSGGRFITVGVRVRGNEMDCYLDGKKVMSGPIDENLAYGGISFKIWDPVVKEAVLIVKDLKVRNIPSQQSD